MIETWDSDQAIFVGLLKRCVDNLFIKKFPKYTSDQNALLGQG